MKITLSDVRTLPNHPRPGLCMRGLRMWGAHHGLDWDTFVREGLDEEVLAATGDPFALRVIAHAKARQHGQG
jgi:hypothetical protein